MSGLKKFVLARGGSMLLYIYHREVWDAVANKRLFTIVAESDDLDELKNMQQLVNKDLKKEYGQ